MPSESIKLVCFDIGGILLRICDGWMAAVQRAGIDPSIPKTGFQDDARFDEALHQLERGEIEPVEYAQRTSEVTGLSPNQVLAVIDAWLLEPYRGIDAVLDRLEASCVQTACLSNTNLRHWDTMTGNGPLSLPLHRFDYRFASPTIGHRKPEAPIYQHVQDETGTPPQCILFFDDLPENIQTAQQKGWHAYAIDPQGDPMVQVTVHLHRHSVLC